MRIYETNAWGGAPGEFCSGSGSTPERSAAYCALIRRFIGTNGIRTVVDLGCGDFRVGRQFESTAKRYIGIDCVPALINYNQRTFGSDRVSFVCRNIIEDELPDGDLCLIRQVLQHLSNAEIQAVLANCRKYRHVIISEHVPVKCDRPNIDKPHGPDVRAYINSGVYVEAPPFNLSARVLLEDTHGAEILRTVLVSTI